MLPLVSLGTVGTTASPASAATIGYRDFSYAGATAPTGQKPQSKLWINDGIWWGSLFNSSTKHFEIYRYDWSAHTWRSTGVLIDERSSSYMDTMWDGTHLYVATAGPTASNANQSGRIVRFSYTPSIKTYARDPGFPVTITNGGTEALVIDKDRTGMVWATYTQGSKVKLTHTTSSDVSWVNPYNLPAGGKESVTPDDISSVVHYDGDKIGVMWSNQLDGNMYFATHLDGAPEDQWTTGSAYPPPQGADDHINLKSLEADAAGRVFAATKTSLDGKNDPLIHLLVLDESGKWTSYTFGTYSDQHTRAIVLLDPADRRLFMFAAAPCCNGGVIYYKETDLDNISFPPGKGTPFIQSDTDPKINNPTSTKQNLSGATGLLVLAGDDSTHYYLHNTLDLGGGDTVPPDTIITSGPSGTNNSSTATFKYSSTEVGSTFECGVDGAAFTSCSSSGVTYTGLSDGSHVFQVRATDAAANVDPTPAARAWTIDTVPPTVTEVFPSDGSTGVGSGVDVTATFSEAMNATTVNGSTFTLVNTSTGALVPATVTYSADTRKATLDPTALLDELTTYTATLKGGTGGVADLAGNPLAADRSWSFATAVAGALFKDGFESGDFSPWTSVGSGGDGAAQVLSGIGSAGNYGAQFSATSNTDSRAYARKALATSQNDITMNGDFRFTSQASGVSVPVMRVLDSSAGNIVTLQRTGGGTLQARYGSVNYNTTGKLALGAPYAHLEMHIVVGGSGAGTVEVYLNGALIYKTTSASLTSSVQILQIGDSTKQEPFTVQADEIGARVGF